MGLFSSFTYKSKKTGKQWWLHLKQKGKARLYYFSKDAAGALFSMPPGFEVTENTTTGMPFLRKKAGGSLFGGKPKKGEAQSQDAGQK